MRSPAVKTAATGKRKTVSYAKWGYIFLIPFFTVYIIFSLLPLLQTFYFSFFERYRSGLNVVGPNFVGLDNYVKLLTDGDLLKYLGNTMVMWIIGFVPQIVAALTLAAWFTSNRLKLKA